MLRRQIASVTDWLRWGQPGYSGLGFPIAMAIWIGVIFGWLEAGQHFVFRRDPEILTTHKTSAMVFWVAPVLVGLISGSVALAASLPSLVVRGWPSLALAALSSAWLGVYGLATLAGKIQKGAAAILAVGVAVTVWRIVRRRPPRTLVRSSSPIFAACLLFTAAAVPALDMWLERRAIGQLGAPPAGAANVLVIVMDTVRADHLSFDGYARKTTPHIDAWAAEGVVFDNAWSSTSWTLPSHASLLSGLPTYRHGADRGRRLEDGFPLLPEVLARHGYRTGAFIANTIWLNPQYGFDRGFHRFRVHTTYSDAARTVWGRKIYSTLIEERGLQAWTVRKTAAHVNADLLEWVDGDPGRPFFALLNYFDVHDPYQPPPPYDTQFSGPGPDTHDEKRRYQRSINLYDGLIAYIDTQIGHLRHELDRRGLARNTIVVITADHGESLGDHNQPQHGRNLHRPVLRVPMVVIAPGLGPGGRRIHAAVGIEQIPATVAALLRLQQGSPFPGDPMTRWLDGAAADGAAPVLGELKQVGGALAAKSLIGSRWQYIWNAPDGREELYDLERDPHEIQNLVDVTEMSATRLDFRKRLHAIFPDLGIWRGTTASAEAGAAAGSPRRGGP